MTDGEFERELGMHLVVEPTTGEWVWWINSTEPKVWEGDDS